MVELAQKTVKGVLDERWMIEASASRIPAWETRVSNVFCFDAGKLRSWTSISRAPSQKDVRLGLPSDDITRRKFCRV